MKISVIGLGKVGSSVAFLLSLRNYVSELVLVGRNRERTQGDALDLQHGQLFADSPSQITTGDYPDTAHSDIIVMCASGPTPADMTDRLILTRTNVELMQEILPQLAMVSPAAKLIMVSNPVDILSYFAQELTGFAPRQIIGTGTLVDSARFRRMVADEVDINLQDIRAYILGEHGNTQFLAMSSASAGGEPLDDTPSRWEMFQKSAMAGLEVFRLKGYTNYTIALAARAIIDSIARNERHTFPVSLLCQDYYGLRDVCLSLPAVIGENGIERVLRPKLNPQETAKLVHSAETLKTIIRKVRSEGSDRSV